MERRFRFTQYHSDFLREPMEAVRLGLGARQRSADYTPGPAAVHPRRCDRGRAAEDCRVDRPVRGGRDTAGVIGGFLGADNRVWITHDRTKAMSSAEWSRTACLLAHETNAGAIYVEWNYGRDMCVLAIGTAWQALQDEGRIPNGKLMPGIDPVSAKQGKLLRAEPIAQQMVEDRVRLRGAFVDLENEWSTWQPTDQDSPGRIDAS